MSSCANIINRLFSEVCSLKTREANTGAMLDLLQINQAIFLNTDLTVYVIPDTSATQNVCGIPLIVEVTQDGSTSTYGALLVLSKLNADCIVTSTKGLLSYGVRTSTGFFQFNTPVPLDVVCADPAILNDVTQTIVVDALRNCANSTTNKTISCAAYDALAALLSAYGVRNLDVHQAACIYTYFNSVIPGYCGPYEPYSPYEPSEPSVLLALENNVFVKQIGDVSDGETDNSNEAIEMKLKALLEATETSEQTE